MTSLEELEDSLLNNLNLINMANHSLCKLNAIVWHFKISIQLNVIKENQFQIVFKITIAIGDQ